MDLLLATEDAEVLSSHGSCFRTAGKRKRGSRAIHSSLEGVKLFRNININTRQILFNHSQNSRQSSYSGSDECQRKEAGCSKCYRCQRCCCSLICFSRGVGIFGLIFLRHFLTKNKEFLCSSERKFPELFKTHPTFVYSPHLVPSMACQTQRGVFLDTLYLL